MVLTLSGASSARKPVCSLSNTSSCCCVMSGRCSSTISLISLSCVSMRTGNLGFNLTDSVSGLLFLNNAKPAALFSERSAAGAYACGKKNKAGRSRAVGLIIIVRVSGIGVAAFDFNTVRTGRDASDGILPTVFRRLRPAGNVSACFKVSCFQSAYGKQAAFRNSVEK